MTLAATCPRCSEPDLTDWLARTRTNFHADEKIWRSPAVGHVVVDGEDTTDGVDVVSLHGSNDRTYQEWRPLRAARCTALRSGEPFLISVSVSDTQGDRTDRNALIDAPKRSSQTCAR
jgi:hypothetical protein